MRTLGEPLSDTEIDDLIQLGLNNENKKLDIECNSLFEENSIYSYSIFCLFLFQFYLINYLKTMNHKHSIFIMNSI